jgi:hypothetical protein
MIFSQLKHITASAHVVPRQKRRAMSGLNMHLVGGLGV